MGICANCGAEIPDESKFCTFCGSPVLPEDSVDSTEKAKNDTKIPSGNTTEAATDNIKADTDNAEKVKDEPKETADNVGSDNKDTNKSNSKMKWYSFIIFVCMFLAAIILLALAALCATGFMYLNDRETIYARYPGMQALNILMAAFYVIMAILAIIARQRLAHYRKNGPRFYIKWLWAVLIGWIEYEAITCMIIGRLVICSTAFAIREFAVLTGAPVLIIAFYILINMFYFHRRKRRELFIH